MRFVTVVTHKITEACFKIQMIERLYIEKIAFGYKVMWGVIQIILNMNKVECKFMLSMLEVYLKFYCEAYRTTQKVD
jgi:hypothetical protein